MHSQIKFFVFLAIIFCLTLAGIFFTANDYQNNPDIFLQDRLDSLSNKDVKPDERYYQEFQAAEYLYKNGKYEEAKNHFSNVYKKYPTISKGYIKLEAELYILKCGEKIRDIQKNGYDTEIKVKNYYKTVD